MNPRSSQKRRPGGDRLTRTADALLLQPSRFRGLYLALGNLFFFAVAVGSAIYGWSGEGIRGAVFRHCAGIVAPVFLVCAVQSATWIVRTLPSLILQRRGLTTFLTGFWPIHLADEDIARVVLHVARDGNPSIAFEPRDRDAVRRRLHWLDRFYFDQSQRLVGYGLSLSVLLPACEFEEFLGAVRGLFGDRFSAGAAALPAERTGVELPA